MLVIFVEEQEWFYLIQSWWDKGIHTFPKGISPKETGALKHFCIQQFCFKWKLDWSLNLLIMMLWFSMLTTTPSGLLPNQIRLKNMEDIKRNII